MPRSAQLSSSAAQSALEQEWQPGGPSVYCLANRRGSPSRPLFPAHRPRIESRKRCPGIRAGRRGHCKWARLQGHSCCWTGLGRTIAITSPSRPSPAVMMLTRRPRLSSRNSCAWSVGIGSALLLSDSQRTAPPRWRQACQALSMARRRTGCEACHARSMCTREKRAAQREHWREQARFCAAK
jgi:hypothetical protein